MTKTGSGGRPWITLEPKPTPVVSRYHYWAAEPPVWSERCEYWIRQIERGWRPNKRISTMGYDEKAEWFGVYLWEYLHVIWPLLQEKSE